MKGTHSLPTSDMDFSSWIDEVSRWRWIASVFWFSTFFVVTLPVIFHVLYINNLDILYDYVFRFTQSGYYLLLFASFIIAQFSYNTIVTANTDIPTSTLLPLPLFSILSHPYRLVYIILTSISSATSIISYLRITYSPYFPSEPFINPCYSTPLRPHPNIWTCFNDIYSFIFFFALCSGLFTSLYIITKQFHVLKFPSLQRQKFFRFKLKVIQSFCTSFFLAFIFTISYYILYFIGFYLNNLHFELPFFFYDISLTAHLYVAAYFFIFLILISYSLIQIFHTHPISFESPDYIAKYAKQNKFSRLIFGLADKHPLTKRYSPIAYLAFLDLFTVSSMIKRRRYDIWDDTSGASWIALSRSCLSVLDTLTGQIESAIQEIPEGKKKNYYKSTTFGSPTGRSTLGSPTGRTRRDEDQPRSPMWTKFKEQQKQQKKASGFLKKPEVYQKKKSNLVDVLKKKLGKWMGMSDKQKTESMFVDLQVQIWSARTISKLVGYSMEEDVYGVVQMNDGVRQTLNSLLGCLLAIEEGINSGALWGELKNVEVGHSVPAGLREPRALITALNEAVYHIVIVFYENLGDLKFPPAFSQKLQLFADFAE